jgi:hypothetical protein
MSGRYSANDERLQMTGVGGDIFSEKKIKSIFKNGSGHIQSPTVTNQFVIIDKTFVFGRRPTYLFMVGEVYCPSQAQPCIHAKQDQASEVHKHQLSICL